MDSGESSECRKGREGDAEGNRIVLDVDLNASPPDVDLNNHLVVDVEDTEDDDVAIISPTMFAEATKSSRRSNNPATEAPPRYDGSHINFDLGPFGNSEDRHRTQDTATSSPLPSPAGPESNSEQQPSPTFTCGICIDKIVEETSTKCGHIFCKECIESAIATQRKCPTCRQKIGKRDTFRVYLPKFT